MSKILFLSIFLSYYSVQAQLQTSSVLTPQINKDCFYKMEDGSQINMGTPHLNRDINILSVVGKPHHENLPSLFEPTNLEVIDLKYINPLFQDQLKLGAESIYMQLEAYQAAVKMLDAAWKQKIDLYIHSAYRSFESQCSVFKRKLKKEIETFQTDFKTSVNSVNTRSAFPGQSEHQLGTTADFVTYLPKYEKPEKKFSGYAVEYEMELTPAYKWLTQNAAQYGFVMSYVYPSRSAIDQPHPRTGYIFEPWHWRYIGRQQALNYGQCPGLVLREYLQAVSMNPQFKCKQSYQPQKRFKFN